MKLLTQLSLAMAVTFVSGSAIRMQKREESPLSIKITHVSDTLFKAALTNIGSEALNVYNKGNFLDKAPVEKLRVYSKDSAAPFMGVRIRYATSNLKEDSFTPLAAGQTVEVDVDVAHLHDLSNGGAVDVVAQGTLMYTTKGSTQISSAVTYDSNVLKVEVDGAKAAAASKASEVTKNFNKRTAVSSDCSGSRRTSTTTALSNCVSLSNAAANAAQSGDAAKFNEYFKTTDATRRSQVAARFRSVASQCSSTTSGGTQTHCTDTYGYCSNNVLAYTLPSQNYIVNCPLYFSALPALTRSCHAQDQATTTLHEMTHAPAVVNPGTQDLGYGYNAVRGLSATNAYNNADTYALYANAIYAGC